FAHRFKDRFFDVAIAEQHAVTFSAGMASKGKKPVFAVYSTFLQRSYDQLLHDCSIEKRHIVLGVDRAGIVGEDGETHQGLFDVSFLSNIPNTTIYSPATYDELKQSLNLALYQNDGIVAVRYPRGAEPNIFDKYKNENYSDYSIYKNKSGKTLVVTYGRIFAEVANACDLLLSEENAFDMLKLLKIHPISDDAVSLALNYQNILFVEEGIKVGGVAEHFATSLLEKGYKGNFKIKAIDNQFVRHMSTTEAFDEYGFSSQKIAEYILQENLI
ncbi:MAG: 1-deoxy-D-xylulose-5-phosphate synthase, partial [Oscillospiraceae bacterium]|nr:1-deoxy-D-xylulose-5-phosphate synthase [Oscillospiraceae bacterium]